jgi:hypothetical protein
MSKMSVQSVAALVHLAERAGIVPQGMQELVCCGERDGTKVQ